MSNGSTTYTLLMEATKLLAMGTPDTDRGDGEIRSAWEDRLRMEDDAWWDAVDGWLEASGDKLAGIQAVVGAAKARQDMFRRQADVLQAAARREDILQHRLKGLAIDLMGGHRELAAVQAGHDDGWAGVLADLKATEGMLKGAEEWLQSTVDGDMDPGVQADAVAGVKAAKKARNAANKLRKLVCSHALESGGKVRLQANPTGLKLSITDTQALPPEVIKEVVLNKAAVKRYLAEHKGQCPGVDAETIHGEHVRWSA